MILDAENMPEWDGTGLPPVGTVCQFVLDEDDQAGDEVEVVAIRSGKVVLYFIEQEDVLLVPACQVRPARPERASEKIREDMASALFDSVNRRTTRSWDSLEELRKEDYRRAVDDGWKKMQERELRLTRCGTLLKRGQLAMLGLALGLAAWSATKMGTDIARCKPRG